MSIVRRDFENECIMPAEAGLVTTKIDQRILQLQFPETLARRSIPGLRQCFLDNLTQIGNISPP
ncbi:MAG: hypothetical protein AB1813_10780 [Verrucomicrobiota bacterium]|jgi:hypothetical protein